MPTLSSRLALDYLRASGVLERLDPHVHPDDEMLATMRALGLPEDAAEFEYLRSGREALLVLEHALARQGRRLSDARRLLEFACGYGRATRWLVRALGPERVRASDILPEAVAFVGARHGSAAFASATEPAQVELGGPHDLVWVGSLFSHLPEPRFRAWLAHLGAALAPDGLLVLSTHGADAAGSVPEFRYERHSENARLSVDEYGTARVHPRRLAELAREAGLRVLDCAECEIWLTQDVHVLARGESPVRAPSVLPVNAAFARGRVELATCDERGWARFGGWVRLPAAYGEPQAVDVRIDAVHAFAAELGAVVEQRTGATVWLARPWYLEGELARFGAGEHTLCAFGRGGDGGMTCFDARSVRVPER
ncbi:MAG: class I SAM-dependent methyltransferase [Planctomycetes bacterium]|nr:class I SAM-dependent methyltransferase [Planctomycetota bacterium]